MRKAIAVVALLSTSVSVHCFAGDYSVSVTRKGPNLYQIDGKRILVRTRYCHEYVYREDAFLRVSAYGGTLAFLDEKSNCDVTGVFGESDPPDGKYRMNVSQGDDDWYEVMGTDTFIRTESCFEMTLGEDALLKLSGGAGTLYFIDSQSNCAVEGVYKKLRS